MKFRVTMKDPDTLGDAIKEAVEGDVKLLVDDPKEQSALIEVRQEKVSEICKEWFKWGEYLTVEIDTEAGTAVVVPVKDL